MINTWKGGSFQIEVDTSGRMVILCKLVTSISTKIFHIVNLFNDMYVHTCKSIAIFTYEKNTWLAIRIRTTFWTQKEYESAIQNPLKFQESAIQEKSGFFNGFL